MKQVSTYLSNKIKNRDIEFMLFVLFFIFMGGYYGYRLFAYAPWYDELYTYYYFISNGPVYSAIHWPVPNNHIGYSVASGLIYVITHNAYIALRGISYLAAMVNILLTYIIGKKVFAGRFGLSLSALYAGMWLVNNLAVQGRGYTFSTMMLLMCILCMLHIILDKEVKIRYYIIWAIGLCMGFYIVTSSLYWVVPLCLCAGIILLIYRRYSQLIRLILYSLISAAATAFLYLVVWLAIGSNLLINEQAEYSGLGHVSLILHHPIRAAGRGIEYMLATPYIQSVERSGYAKAFYEHWMTLLCQLYDAGGVIVIALVLALFLAIIMLVSRALYASKNEDKLREEDEKSKGLLIASVMVLIMVAVTPLVVVMQCKLPYYRVFSFYGFTVAFAIIYLLYVLFGNLKPAFVYVIPIIILVFVFTEGSAESYNSTYGSREEAVCELMKANNLLTYQTVALTDCNQQYMYKFIYDTENENTDIAGSDACIIEKDMLNSNAEFNWEFFYDYSTIPMDELNKMSLVYENDYYMLYER